MFRDLLLLLLFLVFLAALVSHFCSSFSAKSGFLARSIMCNRPRTNAITTAVMKDYCSTGAFVFRAERVGADTMLSQIVRMASKAQRTRAPIQTLADRVAGWFVP